MVSICSSATCQAIHPTAIQWNCFGMTGATTSPPIMIAQKSRTLPMTATGISGVGAAINEQCSRRWAAHSNTESISWFHLDANTLKVGPRTLWSITALCGPTFRVFARQSARADNVLVRDPPVVGRCISRQPWQTHHGTHPVDRLETHRRSP